MMRVAYLCQGKRAALLKLPLPENASVFWLAYDNPTPIVGHGFIFDAECSWAAGRNRLAQLAMKDSSFDYFIFCDDDCEIVSGSFLEFERTLESSPNAAVAVPVMPKARLHGAVFIERQVQGAVVLDEQMVALRRDAMSIVGICPLVTQFDSLSWYVACLIFEHEVFRKYGRSVLQINTLEIQNSNHSWQEPGTAYRRGEWNDYWPVVREWINSNSRYLPSVHEPFYSQFAGDEKKTAVLNRLRDMRLSAARAV